MKINLKNKKEFTEFVKSQKINFDAKFILGLSNHNQIFLNNIRAKYTIHIITTCRTKETAQKQFKKYNRWLTDCENETSVHFALKYKTASCGYEYTWENKMATTESHKVTCKRCLAKMED